MTALVFDVFTYTHIYYYVVTGTRGPSQLPAHMFEASNVDVCFTMEDLCPSLPDTDFDILGSSQLGGAPLYPSQDAPTQTPVPEPRPTRDVRSPDHFTYSAGHVHAQERARKTRRHRGG